MLKPMLENAYPPAIAPERGAASKAPTIPTLPSARQKILQSKIHPVIAAYNSREVVRFNGAESLSTFVEDFARLLHTSTQRLNRVIR